MMTLAATYLVAWEYDRLKPLFSAAGGHTAKISAQFFDSRLFRVADCMGVLWWAIGLGNFANHLKITALLAAAGFVFGLIVATHYRFMPVGHLTSRRCRRIK
ncbi:MAG: hypothetical protein IPK98_16555 [Chloracidobacterium sp.]|nr:hypothetical protein [Chloracidobacterium sp.]